MFGHHDDQSDQKDAQDAPHEPQHDQDTSHESQEQAEATVEDPAVIITPEPAPESDVPEATPAEPAAEDENWQHPGQPIEEPAKAEPADITPEPEEATPEPISDVISPAGGFPKHMTFRAGSDDDDDDVSATPVPSLGSDDDGSSTHELIDIKQKALGELSPLIDDLDLSPEDKFRTIMMMIQASDDQTLVAKAYAAAHTIEDEKTRAQALLDIVNEINYFTTPHENQS